MGDGARGASCGCKCLFQNAIADTVAMYQGNARMRPPLDEPGSEQFMVGRDSIRLWPIVDTVDHRLAAYVAAVVLVACVGYLIN